jgi:hypothetical protein
MLPSFFRVQIACKFMKSTGRIQQVILRWVVKKNEKKGGCEKEKPGIQFLKN